METLDDLSAGLQRLRAEADNLSYSEIAKQISRRRMAGGSSAHAAGISRHTVYNYFQPGRTRMNPKLVFEIVLALTHDEVAAEQWRARCVAIQNAENADSAGEDDATSLVSIEHSPVVSNSEADFAEESPVELGVVRVASTPLDSLAGRPTPEPRHNWLSVWRQHRARLSPQVAVLAVIGGVLLNILPPIISGWIFPNYFPLFLDMIGTATVAIAFGPVLGIVTALFTAFPQALFAAPGMAAVPFWFIPVPIAGALIWAYGVRQFNLGRSLARFTMLNILVGIVCSLIAFPIILNVFGGHTMHVMIQQKLDSAVAAGVPFHLAVLTANMATSIVDKTLVGLSALLIAGTALRAYTPAPIVALVSSSRSRHLNPFRISNLSGVALQE